MFFSRRLGRRRRRGRSAIPSPDITTQQRSNFHSNVVTLNKIGSEIAQSNAGYFLIFYSRLYRVVWTCTDTYHIMWRRYYEIVVCDVFVCHNFACLLNLTPSVFARWRGGRDRRLSTKTFWALSLIYINFQKQKELENLFRFVFRPVERRFWPFQVDWVRQLNLRVFWLSPSHSFKTILYYVQKSSLENTRFKRWVRDKRNNDGYMA